MMISICLYFKVHQPYMLNHFRSADIGRMRAYEDHQGDMVNINQAADACYLPANSLMLSLIEKYQGRFRVSFCISGTMMELLNRYRPDVMSSFEKLSATNCVEFLGETYYNSLSWLYSKQEFKRQVEKHRQSVLHYFNCIPSIFRNTDLIYNNDLGLLLREMGFGGVLCEGVKGILEGRSNNLVYTVPGATRMGLLLRHARLSDDIAFRFEDKTWDQFPLTGEKFASWIRDLPQTDQVVNLFMDYETLGIHKKVESGIFDFLASFPQELLKRPELVFDTPSEVFRKYNPSGEYAVSNTISWDAHPGENNIVWNSNVMQHKMLKKISSMEKVVISSGDKAVLDRWGRLQAADYFFGMVDGFHPDSCAAGSRSRRSFKENYESYSNIVTDFELAIIRMSMKRITGKT